MQKTIIKNAVVNAIATIAYVMAVVAFMSNAERIFEGKEPENSIFTGMAMLLLLIISASVTGLLVLGKPIMWYLDNKKKEAISLFASTVGLLVIFLAILLIFIV